MWPDNETDRDLLNFDGVAATVAELVVQANGRPVSIGISGAWGVGKSSMIKLTKVAFDRHQPKDGPKKYVFVEFNAWLYQGYDDARAALLEVIAARLAEEAEARKTGLDKVNDFRKRVRWLRLIKLLAAPAASMALGLPPVGLAGPVAGLVKETLSGELDATELAAGDQAAGELAAAASGLLDPKQGSTPPKEIQALRDDFEAALEGLGITLVVLIDDLDRCLPPTTISTLEAIRLFLFLQNTAFVIAADDDMIRYAVRQHFQGLPDDSLVTNYFDKLIQIPIKVPGLGTQEVRAYLMMLFVENSTLSMPDKDKIRDAVAQRLKQAWQGKRVDRGFVQGLGVTLPADLVARLDTADRLAPLMATATGIAGNPRLIKRFLNALSIRMSISAAQGVGVNEAVLTKLLLFERLAPAGVYSAMVAAVSSSDRGAPEFLEPWETSAVAGEELNLDGGWNDPVLTEWLALPPALANQDLRGALYVSREHAPLVFLEDRLSSEAAELLSALLEHPEMGHSLGDRLGALAPADTSVMMRRLLDRAGQEQEWGAPPILDACLALAHSEPMHADSLAGFLIERPPSQIQASIVPKIGDQPWAHQVFTAWRSKGVSGPVKAAMTRQEARGNLAE